jgi:hypothetical protein
VLIAEGCFPDSGRLLECCQGIGVTTGSKLGYTNIMKCRRHIRMEWTVFISLSLQHNLEEIPSIQSQVFLT